MKLMQILSSTILFMSLSCILFGQQSGVIKYTHHMKLKIEFDGEAHGIDLSSMLPDSRTTYNDLSFNKSESLYVEGEADEQELKIENEDASIRIEIMEDDTEEILYHNYADKKRLNQTGFMGKSFLIDEEIEKISWKITGEKLKYLGYECIKATYNNDEDQLVVAWFAPKIPCKVGPANYGQLPGAILMLSVGEEDHVYKATEVIMSDEIEIPKPTEGKKVTSEEYEKIMEEKMKEMEMQFGKGGMIIRG